MSTSSVESQASSSAAPTEILKGSSLWSDAWRRLKRNQMAMWSLYFLVTVMFSCFVLAWLPGLPDPNKTNFTQLYAAPSAQHWLGTDQLGRDLLSRMLWGGQISLLVGLVATSVSLVIGVTYGSISGYIGGKVDALMMRIVDILYGLPFLVLVILFSLLAQTYVESVTGVMIEEWGWDKDRVVRVANIVPLFIAISALGWLTMARMARAQVMSLRKQEFVEAANSLGLSHPRILFRHILPNILGPTIIYATLTVPGFILYEASLSFLGLGISAPNASWGTLIRDGANLMLTEPRLLIWPAGVFFLTLLSLNFVGDGLRDALDPKASKD